jgi:hypothetical protein
MALEPHIMLCRDEQGRRPGDHALIMVAVRAGTRDIGRRAA